MTRPPAIVVAASLLPLLAVGGCQRGGNDDVVLATIRADGVAPTPPPEFSRRADCTPMGVYAGPTPGSRYLYRRIDGAPSAREIGSVRDGVVEFRFHDLSRPGLEPLPPRFAIAGLLVTYPQAQSTRRVSYDGQPLTVLGRIRPGETATIPTTETSTLRGSERRVSFPTTITYRMCGDLSVGSARIPVRVYSVGSARRVLDRQAGDHVRQGEVTYFLSAQTGYPLAFQDEATTVIERIEMPRDAA